MLPAHTSPVVTTSTTTLDTPASALALPPCIAFGSDPSLVRISRERRTHPGTVQHLEHRPRPLAALRHLLQLRSLV